jgi:hypothetical protein
VTLLDCPSIDDHHLVSNVSRPRWIKRTHNTYIGQVIRWLRIEHHIMPVLIFVCIMTIQLKSIISDVAHYLLTLMATICPASTTISVVKSEGLKLFLVLRDN